MIVPLVAVLDRAMLLDDSVHVRPFGLVDVESEIVPVNPSCPAIVRVVVALLEPFAEMLYEDEDIE